MGRVEFKELFSELRKQRTNAFNAGGGSSIVRAKWSEIDSKFSELMGFSAGLISKPIVKGDAKACSANLIMRMNYPKWVFEEISYN